MISLAFAGVVAALEVSLSVGGSQAATIPSLTERTTSLSKREAWTALSRWALDKGFSAAESDFEGGTIQFNQNTGTPPCVLVAGFLCRPSYGIKDWADCAPSKLATPRHGLVRLNIVVVEQGTETVVVVDSKFARFNVPTWVSCTSTGVLETSLFSALEPS